MRPALLAVLLAPALAAQPDPPLPSDTLSCVLYDVQPELVGGLAALQAAVVYPEDARAEGSQGRVIVQFVVEADGTVAEARALRTPDARLAPAAVAAVERMTFRPGTQRGVPVAVRFVVPVDFRLPDGAGR